ncbi:hypothetical protein ACFE04_020726 [Oxalis oulophora]
MIIKVARDEDLTKQVGRYIYFDLVDHDKVPQFQIQKQTPFTAFKEEVAKEFGVPVEFQRFWFWAKRQNHTYRPIRPLTSQEEAQSVFTVGQLREASNKTNNAELKLFLEVELGPDSMPIQPPNKTKEDLLLFFKFYNPESGELRYVGRLFVKSSGRPIDILEKLNKMAGFAPNEDIELYEEVKFEPSVWCDHLDKRTTFRQSQIQDGDIICFQKAPQLESEESCQYHDVPSFLECVHNRQVDVVVTSSNKMSVEKRKIGICFDEMSSTMLEKLKDDKAPYSVRFGDFKEINSDKYVDIGIFRVPEILESYAKHLLESHPDIGSGNSPVHYMNEMAFVVLCCALKSMDMKCFGEITESSIFKWSDAIRGASQFGFKVDFLKDKLKSVTQAYLSKLARNVDESKELSDLDDRINVMEKELNTLKGHRSKLYNGMYSELRKSCEKEEAKFSCTTKCLSFFN